MKINARITLLPLLLSLLVSCAASKSVKEPENVNDDGRRNSLLLSYEIRLDTHDRYPGVNGTRLALRCGPRKSLNPYPVCFDLNVPFRGKREDKGYVVNSFELEGTGVFQTRYGDYSLARASYSVLVGQRRERHCYSTKKNPRRCHDEYVDINADYTASLPHTTEFRVAEGEGCYLGHLQLHMRGSSVISYTLDTRFDPQVFLRLPEGVRAISRERIAASCQRPQ